MSFNQPFFMEILSGQVAVFVLSDKDLKQSIALSDTCLDAHLVVHQDAVVELSLLMSQSMAATINITIELVGDHSRADVVVLYGLAVHQKLKINTLQRHVGVNTKSRVVAHGIIKDQASVEYQGMIQLQQGSLKACADQQHTTIVMSRQALAVSIPSIEVSHHDVQCYHGAAIGQFQDQHVQYLSSRGFAPDMVKRILVRSFFEQHIAGFSRLGDVLESLCQKII